MKEGLSRRVKEKIFRLVATPCQTEATVVIVGAPRSGTTWLLELVRAHRSYKAINEPLLYGDTRRTYGFEPRTYVHPEDEAQQSREYIENVLRGQIGLAPVWHDESESRVERLLEHWRRDRVVVKFCRGNRMIHWLSCQFGTRPPVFIVRHPCAVVSSMMRFGAWTDSEHASLRVDGALRASTLPPRLEKRFGSLIEKAQTRVEELTLMWCIDHYVPLKHHREYGYPWVLAPYERLVVRGEEELRRITQALGIEATNRMMQKLREASSVSDRVRQTPAEQLSKWKRHLTDSQIDSVLNVVDRAGFSEIYTEQPEPDYQRLNELQDEQYKW